MDEKKDLYSIAEKRLTEYMVQNKLRKTPERYEILKAVCLMPGLFTIDDLEDKMREVAKFMVSRSTLFNSLEIFDQAHLVIKHTLVRAAHYECNIELRPHICLICMNCGSVKKLEKKREVYKYLSELKVRQFAVHQPILYLHGLCRKCHIELKKKNSKSAASKTNIHSQTNPDSGVTKKGGQKSNKKIHIIQDNDKR